jgi:hypothetical protein
MERETPCIFLPIPWCGFYTDWAMNIFTAILFVMANILKGSQQTNSISVLFDVRNVISFVQ